MDNSSVLIGAVGGFLVASSGLLKKGGVKRARRRARSTYRKAKGAYSSYRAKRRSRRSRKR